MAEQKQGGDANAFIKEYGPIAERIGQQLDVDPKIILAQFGVETGWGKSVIPGTYNLGNIKSASGKGAKATDNVTKTTDAYLRFEDPEVFADYYVDYMKRQYPKVVGAKSNVGAFTTALRPGQRGGYAEDEEYGSKLDNAFSLVSARMGSQQGSQYESTFGVGTPTEAQRMREEGFGETTTTAGAPESETPDLDAALYGAGAGLIAGQVAKGTKIPTSAKYDAAVERLNDARVRLAEAQKSGAGGQVLADLENELKMRQGVVSQAADELKIAEAELKAARAAATAPTAPTAPEGMPGRASGPKVAGASAASNYARAMAGQQHQLPEALLAQVEDYTKGNPKGAHAVIQRDIENLKRIQQIGGGGFELSGTGPGQLMVPPDEAARRAAAMETELAQKQAADAAERARLAQEAQAKVGTAEQRVQAAKQARKTAGTAVGEQSQAVREARSGQKAIERAQTGVNVAEAKVARTPSGPQGVLGKTGAATAKIAPRALGVVSGAATGMAAMEAIDRFKKGDYTGAVIPTLEATFGVMSMLPPAHPVLAALRGLGTIGGAALLGYEGYKYATKEPPPSADVAAP